MRFYQSALVLGGVVHAAAAGSSQQNSNKAANAAPAKIAVISMRDAIVGTAEGKQASAQLNVQFTPQQTALDQKRKEIEDLQRRLQQCERTCSDEEKARITRRGELLTSQLNRENQGYQEEVQAAQSELIDGIGRKVLEVLDRFARENGYAVVLDKSSQTSPVLTNSPQVDITNEVVRLYDAQYPVKATGAPASKQPATPAAPPKKPGSK